MDFFLAARELNGFAARGRDDVDLRGIVFSFFFTAPPGFVVFFVRFFIVGRLAFGQEGDPAAVRGPFGFGVMAGLRELDGRAAISLDAVEPEIFAKNLPIPVGAVGGDYYRVAVGR